MAELADALDLGSSEQPSCRFNSCYPHLIFKAESILVYECFSAFFFVSIPYRHGKIFRLSFHL